MAIFSNVMWVFSEMLALPDFLSDPFLALGVQYIGQSDFPEFHYPNLNALLHARGIKQLDELDPFDAAASLKWNLNYPVPEESHERYATVFDIGCAEHIFDTRQVFENCLRMVRVGGLYAAHLPVSGHSDHGLHTFHSELVPRVLKANGFELVYLRYTTQSGNVFMPSEKPAVDGLVWAVGRKLQPLETFHSPEQSMYAP
jgi:hypothetical protein